MKCQSLDEGMIKFKGRVSYLQYMPAKPMRRGIKVWILCDSKTGYMNQFEFYLGKRGTTVSKDGLYFDIVSNLTKCLRYKNHHVFFDNLYTSIPLLLHLQKYQILCCGTIRKNRKYLPSCIKKTPRLNRGEHKTMQDAKNRNLSATVWKDTKDVRFASMLNRPSVSTTTVRRIRGQHVQVSQPSVANLYQLHYAGVDRFDQLRSSYAIGRPSKKSWKYLFNFLLNSAMVNAFILYKKASERPDFKKNYTQFDFRSEVAHSLIGGYTKRKRCGPSRPSQSLSNNPQNVLSHESVHMEGKRARLCYVHKRYTQTTKETVFGCKTCCVNLCKDCHYKFHRQTF